MIKVFYLPSCSTCKRIINDLNLPDDTEMHDIKSTPINKFDLKKMKDSAGSYEAIFSKRAVKYRGMGLHEQTLNEDDYKRLILDEYTFLKRPVIFVDDNVFIGNSKKVVESAKQAIESLK